MVHEQEQIRAPFKNEHLSVSRLKRYDKCPLDFKFSYVDGRKEDMGKDAADLGKLVHRALELIYRQAWEHRYSGSVPDKGVIRFYRRAFEEAYITSDAAYREGLAMVRSYLAGRSIDHSQILDLEQEFRLPLEDFQVFGYIDRIDKVDDSTAKVIDYKTGRYVPTRDELNNDLQLSVYGLVVLQRFSWVKYVQYELEMVRHNITLSTTRTPEQLMEAAHYVVSLGKIIESTESMPAKLNELCPWCDHRGGCHAYQDALRRGEGELRFQIASDDVERLSAERERAANLERIARSRRKEVDKLLSAHVSRCGQEDGMVVGARRYKMVQRWDADYPRGETMELLAKELGLPREAVEKRLAKVNGESIQGLLREMRLSSSKHQVITMRLQQIADRAPCKPYISSSKIFARRKAR
jgi:RecB family exonuclease/AraC-like DNA-binding protein